MSEARRRFWTFVSATLGWIVGQLVATWLTEVLR
jgi:hypothetical protein